MKQKCRFVLREEQKTTNQSKSRQKQMYPANMNAVMTLTDEVCECVHTLAPTCFKRVWNEFGTGLERRS